MVIRIRLTPADLEVLQHRADHSKQTLRACVSEIVACAAADLREPPRFRVTRLMVSERKPATVERPEDDDLGFNRCGRSATELDRLHAEARARK